MFVFHVNRAGEGEGVGSGVWGCGVWGVGCGVLGKWGGGVWGVGCGVSEE
ncbi:hypothetical protein [Microcystis sp. LE19-8.1F]|nr:hypothetical protein [Microcystis sp. LE19-8.1F]MCZ8214053.1 hypothetical protein [Microcystis sp. LE19-8.1F]